MSSLPPSTTTSNHHQRTKSKPIYKIVLTGGPCAGKTTALSRLSTYLRERGFEVATVPEAFTMLMTNGITFDYFGVEDMAVTIQTSLLSLQKGLEDSFEEILKKRGKPSVMLCDRGLMDGSAYLSAEEWDRVMEHHKMETVEAREGRYNAIFHLVTAAQGAEKYYTLGNNEARTETLDEARSQDEKTRLAWLGHPKLRIFDNSTDFEGKLQSITDEIANMVGLPTKLQRRGDNTVKFLLKSRPNLEKIRSYLQMNFKVFQVEKVYLYDHLSTESESASGEYSFVRKRTYGNNNNGGDDEGAATTVYGVTTVTKDDNQEIEVKRIISKREYYAAIKARDESRHIVKQTRISFLWNTQSCTIHIYKAPVDNLCLLHVQKQGSIDDVDIPPFIDVERQLDSQSEDDKQKFGAYSLSLVRKKRHDTTLW